MLRCCFNSFAGKDTDHFTNEITDSNYAEYGLDTEHKPSPFNTWIFFTAGGSHGARFKVLTMAARAVSSDNIIAPPPPPVSVSAPDAVWLFGSGLIALMGFNRRGNIG